MNSTLGKINFEYVELVILTIFPFFFFFVTNDIGNCLFEAKKYLVSYAFEKLKFIRNVALTFLEKLGIDDLNGHWNIKFWGNLEISNSFQSLKSVSASAKFIWNAAF